MFPLIRFPISCLCPLQITLHGIIFLIQLWSHYSPFKYFQWLPIIFLIKYKLLTLAVEAPYLPFQSYFPPLLYLSPALVKLDYLLLLESVTTHDYLTALAHAVPSVLSSQSAETSFHIQSSLQVPFLNRTKLSHSLMAPR